MKALQWIAAAPFVNNETIWASFAGQARGLKARFD
jgi:hypothetical protein